MHKKSLILVSVVLFVLCIFSGFVSANTDVKGAVSNTVNDVVNGVNALGSDVRSGIGSAENGIEDALKINNNSTTNNSNTGRASSVSTDNYAATRTAMNTTTTNNSTLWIWLVIAIAAIVIIGLVWYYGAQNNMHHGE